MIANYHTHTTRCGHAKGEDREYVEHAIASGLKILGFADHTYYPVLKETWNFPGMDLACFEDYVDSIQRLKNEYKDDIEIYLGVEAEYYPDYFDGLLKLMSDYPIEYMILGQHYLGNRVNEPLVKSVTDDITLLKRYCKQVIEAMETGVFSYLAHPDLVYDMGESCIFEEYMRKVCRVAKRCEIPLELNLAGISSNIHYPNEQFWKIAGEEGCQVIFGSDAHKPDFVRPVAEINKAMDIVNRYNLHLIDTVKLRKPAKS